MKRSTILCLILIGLTSFNFVGCISNYKYSKQTSEEQENMSSKTNEEDINKVLDNQEKDKVAKENNTDIKITKENKKQIYKDKLDSIQLGLKDLDDLYSGNTIEMKSAASQEYERWDTALNEIYDILKQQLLLDDMNKLKEEQIKWISDRDDKAKNASLEYEGGTAEQLVYISSLAQTTKERCYELVEKYMK